MNTIDSECQHKMIVVKDSEYNELIENVQEKFHVTQPSPSCFVCEKKANTEFDIEANIPFFEDTPTLNNNQIKSLFCCKLVSRIYQRILLYVGVKQMTD